MDVEDAVVPKVGIHDRTLLDGAKLDALVDAIGIGRLAVDQEGELLPMPGGVGLRRLAQKVTVRRPVISLSLMSSNGGLGREAGSFTGIGSPATTRWASWGHRHAEIDSGRIQRTGTNGEIKAQERLARSSLSQSKLLKSIGRLDYCSSSSVAGPDPPETRAGHCLELKGTAGGRKGSCPRAFISATMALRASVPINS